MGNYVTAFLVGGFVCAIGQVILDNTKYTPAHILVGLVVLGSILTGIGLYEPIMEFAGAGVSVLVANFGYVLTKGVMEEAANNGLLGLFKGVLKTASAGVSASVIIAFFVASLFNPRT